MRYTVVYTPTARRAFNEIPYRVAVAILDFCEGPLAEQPHRLGKPLRNELSGLHSARRGQYRVIYRIVEDQLIVDIITVGHRGHIYRSN